MKNYVLVGIAVVLFAALSFSVFADRIFVRSTVSPEELLKSDFFLGLGNELMASGRENLALSAYERGLSVGMNKQLLEHNIGVYHYNRGDMAEAVAHFRNAIALDRNYEQPYISLSVLYHEQQDYDAAIAVLRELILINPDEAQYHYDLAINIADNVRENGKGDLQEAIDEFAQAEALSPGFEHAKENIDVLTAIVAKT